MVAAQTPGTLIRHRFSDIQTVKLDAARTGRLAPGDAPQGAQYESRVEDRRLTPDVGPYGSWS